MHHNFRQTGQRRRKLDPEPFAHVLDGGIFQPLDFVEIAVVELFHQRFHRLADFGVIVNPARLGVALAFHRNLQLEAVAVHLLAFVTSRGLGQRLRGLEIEIFGETELHGARLDPAHRG